MLVAGNNSLLWKAGEIFMKRFAQAKMRLCVKVNIIGISLLVWKAKLQRLVVGKIGELNQIFPERSFSIFHKNKSYSLSHNLCRGIFINHLKKCMHKILMIWIDGVNAVKLIHSSILFSWLDNEWNHRHHKTCSWTHDTSWDFRKAWIHFICYFARRSTFEQPFWHVSKFMLQVKLNNLIWNQYRLQQCFDGV